MKDVEYQVDDPIDTQQLLALFKQTDWADKRVQNDVETMLLFSTFYVTAVRDDQLIGFARVFTDRRYRAFIEDVIVDVAYRKEGVGKQLINIVLDQLKNVDEIALGCSEQNTGFYQLFGFEKVFHPLMKKRNDIT